ncbi:putative queuine tRNA-ribosyltransferase [Trypanosoma grayi]|uniref:putative queuine tRNA-ribosyltransferase n=1 Tax=Trypanosoma grayi TaxID=71804 RepID=UPI0004F418E5|nr:putative queuine tRNA-ribosyltransferase [Trypanosoma grayi]KEG12941.1 putative queuine tRNA-ribosyltransferase [Trypanosoma grayi]
MSAHSPVLVIPCRRGGIPFLTPDQIRAILNEEERVMSVSIFDASEYVLPCKKAQQGFAEFCALADFTTILTVQSPFIGMHTSAPATDTAVCGYHEKGRVSFTVEKWSEIVLAIRPAIAIPLYDAISLYETQTKRRRTATARSARWSKASYSIQDQSGCKLMKPLCTVDQGDNEDAEYVFMDELGQNETLQQYSSCVKEAAAKRTVMSTAASVAGVLMCLKAGVTFIECALPWMLAEKGICLTFDMVPASAETPSHHESQIDLNDYDFAVDIQPLAKECSCYTCTRHTRAYIHHLLTVQEMNSKILLAIHNLTRLVQLVRLYRRSGPEARETLLKWLFAQL